MEIVENVQKIEPEPQYTVLSGFIAGGFDVESLRLDCPMKHGGKMEVSTAIL